MSLSKAPYSVPVRGLFPCIGVNVWICDVHVWLWICEWVNLNVKKGAYEWVNLNVRKWICEFWECEREFLCVLPACLRTWTGLGGVLTPAAFGETWWQRSRNNPESWPPGWSETPRDRVHTVRMHRSYGWSVPPLSGLPIDLETLEDRQRTNRDLHDVNKVWIFSPSLQFMLKNLLLKSTYFKTQQINFDFNLHNIII